MNYKNYMISHVYRLVMSWNCYSRLDILKTMTVNA